MSAFLEFCSFWRSEVEYSTSSGNTPEDKTRNFPFLIQTIISHEEFTKKTPPHLSTQKFFYPASRYHANGKGVYENGIFKKDADCDCP